MNISRALRADLGLGSRRSSLRTYLVAVILLSTVPLALLLSYQVFEGIRAQRERLESDLDRGAEALALGVDRELATIAAALESVARAEDADGTDMEGLRRELLALQRQHGGWRGVFLRDAEGRVQFDSAPDSLAAPPVGAASPEGLSASAPEGTGAPERAGAPANAAAAADSHARRFAVSGVQPLRGGGQAVVVTVPLDLGTGAPWQVGARIDATLWQRLLQASPPPADGYLLLFDGNGRIIARAPGAADAVGRELRANTRAAISGQRAGRARVTSLEGRELLIAWNRLGESDWGAGVAVHATPLDGADRRAFVIAFTTAGACMLLGLSLGLLLARRLIQPLDALASVGQVRAVRPSRILEIDRLRERLVAAHEQGDAAIARLEAKAAEFQTLFDSSPIGMTFAQDRECRFVVHNPAMRALFGPLPGTRSAPAKVLHEGRPLPLEEQPLYRAARSGESVAAMELHIDSGDGRPTVVLAHAVPLRDASGQPRGAIGAAVDITRRKEDERRLLQADERLRENQSLIDLAQEAGQVGFFNYDYERGQVTWSPGQARLFGLDADANALTPMTWLSRVDPSQHEHLQALLRQMTLLGQERETFDYQLHLPDGSARWMSSRVLQRYRADGAPRQLIGVTVDVTRHKASEIERAQLAEKEQNARHQAEAANRAKDEILAMLGHELRNPLGAVSSAVEVMQRIDRNSPMGTNALEIMARQTANLARIMDDLLDVAGVISGRVMLARVRLDLAALAQRAVATLRLRDAAAGQRIVERLSPVWVDADSTRMEQVLMNLVGNAVKHTPEERSIEVCTGREGDTAVLRVRDHGGGIEPDLLERMFDLFVQGERPLDRRGGGLGVGLTLVRRLVNLHDGTVTAHSGESGSVFEVRLPAVDPAPLRMDVAARGAERRIAARRVVLVEDNPDAAEALRTSLELDGHEVWGADDGVAGLAAIVERRPDVAIVDLGLPGLTGFEVALRSRAAGFPGLMIATSGYGQAADTRRTLEAGFDTHMIKPVDAERLREWLAKA